jgi:hypothetical protein
MFAFTKVRTVRRKVVINVPKDGEGFDLAPRLRHVGDPFRRPTRAPVAYNRKFFQGIITNIEDLVDEEKKPITFTKEFLADFVAVDYVLAALQREYITCTVAAGRGN